MNRYTIYCTKEQTEKALELGAPIEVYNHFDSDDIREANIFYKDKFIELSDGKLAEHTTAEQMIGWLSEERGLIFLTGLDNEDKFFFNVYHNEGHIEVRACVSRKEATLAAIDEALDYLTINKKNESSC